MSLFLERTGRLYANMKKSVSFAVRKIINGWRTANEDIFTVEMKPNAAEAKIYR